MKNLIIISILTIFSIWQSKSTAQTTTSLNQDLIFVNNDTYIVKIPDFKDFNPEYFFETIEADFIKECYQYENMKEYYTITAPNEAEEIRNCPGFDLVISKSVERKKLSRAELFLVISYFSKLPKNQFGIDVNTSDTYFVLQNDQKFYIQSPISRILSNDSLYSVYQKEKNYYFSK